MTDHTMTSPSHDAMQAALHRARAERAKAMTAMAAALVRRLTAPFRRPADPVARAIAELEACSDRELADLGIGRGDIRDVVRHGRPGIDDVAAPANDRGTRASKTAGRHAA